MRVDMDSPVGKLCLKCRHMRRREDTGPVYACPACGAIYAKVAAVVQAKEEERREAARNFASAPPPPPPEPEAGPPVPDALAAERRRVQMAHLVYGLMLLPLGITPVVGAVIAHAAAANDPGSWLASHFRWQLRTFWIAAGLGLLLALIAGLLIGGARLAARQSGAEVGASGAAWLWLPAIVLGLWVLYRIGRGWFVLLQGEAA